MREHSRRHKDAISFGTWALRVRSKRPFRNSLSGAQLVKQGFGLFHVERVEAFGKRTADWCKQVERLCFAVAVAQ
jgi:hypothetical protein